MPEPRNEAAIPAHVAEQYEAGYSARFRDEAYSLGATLNWQAGWNDANRELGKFDEAFSPAQSSLPFFGTGDETRRRELPFDPSCSEEWKRSWIEADIRLGLARLRAKASRAKPKQGGGDGEAMESLEQ